MTVLRRDPLSINNYFNELFSGVGHRGSSFMDVDGLMHDGKTHRFLVHEFKREDEVSSPGQMFALKDLAREGRFTVFYQVLLKDGRIRWADLILPESMDVITPDECRSRVAAWWANRYDISRYADVTEELVVRPGWRK